MKTVAEGGGKGAAQLPKVAVLFSACFHKYIYPALPE